ncbi:hypothetical protein PIB30_051913 [Stylosanthes scabra]|uniref:Peptidase A1 domain-containing protein n=1 Tax=Stylosanthes scabra TaxID=79078 RepID=A0ABU6QIR7_9FABA|nr:hypothetical protein [Stylosanthes scabra]
MDLKGTSGVVPLRKVLLLVLTLCVIFSVSLSNMNDTTNYQILNSGKPKLSKSYDYTFHFALHGNVYPLGCYKVKVAIGNPPKLYKLDIDSGSDLTWVQSKPYKSCPPHSRYYPYNPNNNLPCNDPLCVGLNKKFRTSTGACGYTVEYGDGTSSSGVLVRDFISFRLDNDSILHFPLGFGIGVDQKPSEHHHFSHYKTDGVFGLGNGKISILSQLSSLGYIRNLFGHCLSSKGGGRLFLGNDKTSKSSLVWTQMLKSQSSNIDHYRAGPVDLLFNGKQAVKGVKVNFDSGSAHTYLNQKAYKALFDLMNNDLGKRVQRVHEDDTLAICWKGQNLFGYFKNIVFNFPKTSSQLILTPQSYLIVSDFYNTTCLGILDSSEAGLGDVNIIGDISLQDKLVVYDNEKMQIGWRPDNCASPRS